MRVRIAGASAALVLLVGGCAGDDADAPGTPTPTTPAPTAPDATGPPSPTAEPTAEPTSEGEIVEVRDGQVVGGRRTIDVELGDEVTITVASDVADHVHVHGYDILADVEAGGTATVRFTADIPGQFEVELEEAGLLLAELVVRG